MTDTIRIDAGEKRILINDGPEVLVFNPTDVVFVEKFYNVVGEFKQKQIEYEERATEIDGQVEVDPDGLPINMAERLKFVRELCQFSRERIDFLFGEGTSQNLFGDVESLDMVEQFFTVLTPFVQQERDKKIEKYRASQGGKVLK